MFKRYLLCVPTYTNNVIGTLSGRDFIKKRIGFGMVRFDAN